MKKLFALAPRCSLWPLVLPGAAAGQEEHQKPPPSRRRPCSRARSAPSGADGAYTDRKFGKAQLVDNRKRDKLSVHLRRLAPSTRYTFALYSVAKGSRALPRGRSGGTQETAFPPRTKRTNKAGEPEREPALEDASRPTAGRRYFVLVSGPRPWRAPSSTASAGRAASRMARIRASRTGSAVHAPKPRLAQHPAPRTSIAHKPPAQPGMPPKRRTAGNRGGRQGAGSTAAL